MTLKTAGNELSGRSQDFQRTVKIEALANGIINAFINGGRAWLMLGGGDSLTPGGDNSYIADTVVTAFVLPFILSLIVISLTRRKRRAGKISAVELYAEKPLHNAISRFTERVWSQALLLAVIAVLVTAPLVIGLLWTAGLPDIPPATYAVLKGVWCGILAAALVLPAFLLALRSDR